MKALMALGLVLIIGALASAGIFMLKRPSQSADKANGADTPAHPSKHMARALAFRVALSIALFLIILFSYWMGWIQPTGIPLSQQG